MGRKQKETKALEIQSRITGIAGTGKGVGCTHFSIMLLNYLAGFQRKKAVLLEFNRSGTFEILERVCTGRTRQDRKFRILDADYCKNAGQKELAGMLEQNYEEILIDFGSVDEAGWTEFLRCGNKFLIGSFSEWQQERFREFELQKRAVEKKSWKSLAVFGSEETRKEFRRRYRIDAGRIPFSADAFVVTEDVRKFFETLI